MLYLQVMQIFEAITEKALEKCSSRNASDVSPKAKRNSDTGAIKPDYESLKHRKILAMASYPYYDPSGMGWWR